MSERIHELKTRVAAWPSLPRGARRVEIRRDDRDYRVGDVLRLREWDHGLADYTGNECKAVVRHVLYHTDLACGSGLVEGYVALTVDTEEPTSSALLLDRAARVSECGHRAVLDALVRHARADERADVLRRVADTATYVSQEAFHHYLDAAAREAELQRECAAELRRTHRSSLEARGVVRWVAGRDEAYCVHDGETWPCMHERLAAGWSADPGQDDEEEQ